MTDGTATILLVDDDDDVRLSLGRLVETTLPLVRVLTAADAEAGLTVLRGTAVDVLVSDFRMPGMDGVSFLRAARRVQPGLLSLMVTAYPTPELAGAAVREAGIVMLVSKPFDPATFVQLLRSLVSGGAS